MLYLCDVLDDEDTFPLLMRDCNYINLQNSVSVHTYVHIDWISGKYRTIPLLFIKNMKMKKVRNTEIAATVNKKWGKNYTPNYISTIFRQRIIPKINEAAAFHVKIVSNIFFEEEFKACTCCGKVFLRCPENFTKNSRAKDGLVARCKACEKAARK